MPAMRLLRPNVNPGSSAIWPLIAEDDSSLPTVEFRHFNPLRDPPLAGLDDLSHVITWSGTPSPDLSAPDPRTWTGDSLRKFHEWCDRVCPAAEQSPRFVFRLHARHVLSDTPGARRFLSDRGERFGIALSPATMIELSMVETLDEHLERMFEGLGDRADFIWLHDVQIDASGEWFDTVPLGSGIMPATLIRSLLAACVPEETPIIIEAGNLQEARSWLGL